MSEFDAFYFIAKSASHPDYKVVKIGDSRSYSTNATNYRGDAEVKKLHGNNNGSSVGKEIEKAIMPQLVEKKMAVKIGGTESYIVANSTAKSLEKMFEDNTIGKIITKHQIQAIKGTKIYFKVDRVVPDDVTGEKF